MSTQLAKYDAARRAVGEARRVDEVLGIRDEALRARAYAKIAKDRRMMHDAEEILRRAEEKLGVIMKAQAKTVGKAKGGQPHQRRNATGVSKTPVAPTLAEAGIDKNLAKRARSLAALGDGVFEKTLADARRKGVAPTMALVSALADAAADRELETPAKTKREPSWPKPSPLYDPWSKLSHAARAIADYRFAQLADLARQSRRGGFLEIDLKHADKALVQLAAWRDALAWEMSHGQTQHRDTEAHREGARASEASRAR